jgi:hypothetical protein
VREKAPVFSLTDTAFHRAFLLSTPSHSEQAMTDLTALKSANAKRWANARLTT